MRYYLVLFVAALLLISLPYPSFARKGGGGGGRIGGSGRVSSGRVSSSSSNWGSSRTSGSKPAAPSSNTKWGSSAPSGSSSSSRYSAGGGYGSKPSLSSGQTYRAPSRTMSRVASPGTARANYRPQASIPAPSRAVPTRVVYSTVYTSSYGRRGFGGGSMLLAGGAGLIGGYYLGRMIGGMSRPYGYGYGGYGGGYGYGPSPYQTYVPYRDRYEAQYPSTPPPPGASGQAAEAAPDKQVDLCTLARWNRELPFSELPNMAVDFLANDTVSGNANTDKSKFLYEFFKGAVLGFDTYNSSADVFTIPAGYDLSICNFRPVKDADVTRAAQTSGAEEPIITSARNVIQLYSNISKDSSLLQDLVAAAKACLPRGSVVPHPEVLPCLDFSLTPDQLIRLKEPHSVFGNGEICRRQLNPDMFKCVPSSSATATCLLEHLVALNLFARNYYLCTNALEDETMKRIQSMEQTSYDGYNSASSLPARLTTAIGLLRMVVVGAVYGIVQFHLRRQIV